MQTPMLGQWSVLIHAVRPFTIHGDLYYEITATRTDTLDAPIDAPTDASTDAPTPFTLRIPQHAIPSPPAENQRLRLTFLMGQVTAATPLPD